MHRDIEPSITQEGEKVALEACRLAAMRLPDDLPAYIVFTLNNSSYGDASLIAPGTLESLPDEARESLEVYMQAMKKLKTTDKRIADNTSAAGNATIRALCWEHHPDGTITQVQDKANITLRQVYERIASADISASHVPMVGSDRKKDFLTLFGGKLHQPPRRDITA